MSFIGFLILGILAGWIAGNLMGPWLRRLRRPVLGIIDAFAGAGLPASCLVTSRSLGAVIVVAIYRALIQACLLNLEVWRNREPAVAICAEEAELVHATRNRVWELYVARTKRPSVEWRQSAADVLPGDGCRIRIGRPVQANPISGRW
jgi:uncharacterized membrane protein YeaQ/YmgE (transglycosylase-associated protein family)